MVPVGGSNRSNRCSKESGAQGYMSRLPRPRNPEVLCVRQSILEALLPWGGAAIALSLTCLSLTFTLGVGARQSLSNNGASVALTIVATADGRVQQWEGRYVIYFHVVVMTLVVSLFGAIRFSMSWLPFSRVLREALQHRSTGGPIRSNQGSNEAALAHTITPVARHFSTSSVNRFYHPSFVALLCSFQQL